MASLILEDLGTASELQRQTKSMLDRASVRPISIPRERNGEAITMVNRALELVSNSGEIPRALSWG